jgi:ERCC4-type nuclease
VGAGLTGPAAQVLFDHRELRSGVPEALAAAGLHAVARDLPVGDYVLSDRVVVERKSGADLAASIKDRRLFEQVGRLTGAYPVVVLVVEGEPVHIGAESWRSAVGRALLAGVALLLTADAVDTARWIARLHRLEGKGPSRARGATRVRRPTEDDARTAEDVLTSLPGISTVGARRLLAHFGSLAAVFAADERALRAVAGIGPVRGGALARVFAAGPAPAD